LTWNFGHAIELGEGHETWGRRRPTVKRQDGLVAVEIDLERVIDWFADDGEFVERSLEQVPLHVPG
jgi:hypothetical protein